MAYPKFEDLQVWQKAKDLAVQVIKEVGECPQKGVTEHLERIAMLIMINIAKGYERKGAKEFDRFLYIARGYCGEFRSVLYVAEEVGCINTTKREELYETSVELSKMLTGLIKSIFNKANGQKEENGTQTHTGKSN